MVRDSGSLMKVSLRGGLPFIQVEIHYQGQIARVENTLLDTGSMGSVFSADRLIAIGLSFSLEDNIRRICGVGGSEFVFTKRIEKLVLGDFEIPNVDIEVGAMDYGFEINGIIGMDILTNIGAIIDLSKQEIRIANEAFNPHHANRNL